MGESEIFTWILDDLCHGSIGVGWCTRSLLPGVRRYWCFDVAQVFALFGLAQFHGSSRCVTMAEPPAKKAWAVAGG